LICQPEVEIVDPLDELENFDFEMA